MEYGDKLTQEFNLTASQWQVMGVVAENPQTISAIARIRGIQRQSVQRTVNLLYEKKMIFFQENPHHKRAKLVTLSKEGDKIYKKIMNKYSPDANSIGNLLKTKNMQTLKKYLGELNSLDFSRFS